MEKNGLGNEQLNEALAFTGFAKCEWGPDDTTCDRCKTPNRQLYFGNQNYWDSREGDYWCGECVMSLAIECQEINRDMESFDPAIHCNRCGVAPLYKEGCCEECYSRVLQELGNMGTF